jgi:hypothetical protein
VDYGAFHNILKKKLVGELRLKVELCGGSDKEDNSKGKAVNSMEKVVVGVASQVQK